MKKSMWVDVLATSGVALFVCVGVAHADPVGRTAGQFAVSPAGAATYTIPIWAPPGPKAMGPHIALTYSSQQGNGYLGVGWGLSGLSSIYRCNRTYAQDGTVAAVTLSVSDDYCLDGQRLRLTSGTHGVDGSTYQTELANFDNIIAHSSAGNGPGYFTVQTPDGRTLQYGNGGGSQVLASGGTTALSWALNQVSDAAGNTMTIGYSAATGTVVPSTISWAPTTYGTSSYAYTMQFVYGTNVLPPSGYVAGTPVQNPNLLSSVTINYGGSQVKEYVLTYQQSGTTGRDLLTQVQECAGSTSSCLSPTTITYQAGMAGVTTSATTVGSGTVATCAAGNGSLVRYDFNGDGYPDLLYAQDNTCYVAFGSVSGFGSPVSTGITLSAGAPPPLAGDLLGTGKAGLLANNGGTWYYYSWNDGQFVPASTGLAYDSTSAQYTLADVNGDGLPDLVEFYESQGTASMTTRLNTSSGGIPSFSGSPVVDFTGSGVATAQFITPDSAPVNVTSYDFNGDGLQDALFDLYQCVQPVPTYINPSGCGQYDYVYYELLSQPGGTFSTAVAAGQAATNTDTPLFGNVNDDACTDAVLNTAILISVCNGNPGAVLTAAAPVVAVMDWNGDGLADLIESSGGALYVQLSTGTGFGPETAISGPPASGCTFMVFDANADGLDDLGCSGTSGIQYYLHNGSGTPPDLLTSITDGFGSSAAPTYVPLTQGNYTAGSGSYPDVPSLKPRYVVSQVTFSDPSSTGGTYTQQYQYTGSTMNLLGRGWEGFSKISMLDSRTGLTDARSYLQTFPYTGMQYEDLVSNGGTPVSESLGTQTKKALNSAPYPERWFPYFSNVTAQKWELGGSENGQLITTVSTTYNNYDDYGNAASIASTVTDNDPASPYSGDSWTTTTTTVPDPSTGPTWCLNLVTQTQVAYAASIGGAVTRTKQFTPDLTNCRYSQVITEPGSSYQVTEALGYDSSFGNLISDAVTGSGMATRTTGITWDATGRFPATVTNALGQNTSLTFDPIWGQKTSVTDPNGIAHSWAYDQSFGRLSQETREDGTYTTWSYTDCGGGCLVGSHGLVSTHTDYNSDHSTIMSDGTDYYDPVGRPLVHTQRMLANGAYSRNEQRYDSLGNVSWQATPCQWTTLVSACPSGTTLTRDAVGRVTQSQLTGFAATKYTYTGRMLVTTDPNGNAKTTITGVNGWLREALDANGYAVIQAYDAAGSRTGTTDNQGRQLWSGTVQYGIAPFTVNTTDSALGSRSYTIDALGEVTAYSDGNGNSFSEQYDALSRPTSRTEPDLFTQWTWGTNAANHEIGKLASVCTGTGTNPTACTTSGYSESESYDIAGRVSQRSIVIPNTGGGGGTFNYGYQYNSSGLLGTLTYPATTGTPLQLGYVYGNGILQSITDVSDSPNVTVWTAGADNPAGQLTQETLGNGVVVNRNFNPVTLWLNSITAGVGGGTALENQDYEYDPLGNVLERQDNRPSVSLTENFNYDSLNRLYSSQLIGASGTSTNLQVCYDNSGGGCTENQPGPGFINAKTADAIPAHSYTATWTSYNYPASIATPTESVQLSYGPDRQRWQQNYNDGMEVTNYIGHGLEQVVAGGNVSYRQYVYAGSEPVAIQSRSSSGSAWTYMLSDHQGSVAALLNASGGTVVDESFTAYGERRDPSTWSGAASSMDLATIAGITRQGYTFQTALGQSMGFNHMNGRVQDASTGQFLSPDPVIQDPTNTQNYNRYAYVVNNPVTLTDPSGYDSCPGYLEEQFIAVAESNDFQGNGGMSLDSNGNFNQLTIKASFLCGPDNWPSGSLTGGQYGGSPGGFSGGSSGGQPSQNSPAPPNPPSTITVPPPPAAPRWVPQTTCQRGWSIGNYLTSEGGKVAGDGAAISAGGGLLIAGGAMASLTVVAAPEGFATMAGGALVASIGGYTSVAGVAMQVVGAGLNIGRNGLRSFWSSAIQAGATAANRVIDSVFPNLPDVLSAFHSNPIEAGADAISERLGSCQ